MVENGISLQDLIDKFQLSPDQLKEEFSDEHLKEVSRIIEDHETVGQELGLTAQEVTAISSKQELQRMTFLRKWKQKCAWKATYKQLIEAFLRCSRADYARHVCELLTKGMSPEQPATPTGASYCDASCQTDHDATCTSGREDGYKADQKLEQVDWQQTTAPINTNQRFGYLLKKKLNATRLASDALLKGAEQSFKRRNVPVQEIAEAAKYSTMAPKLSPRDLSRMSMDEVWVTLRDHTSWYNSEVVEAMVTLHGDNCDKKNLTEFKGNRRHLMDWLNKYPEHGKEAKMILKMEEEFKNFTDEKLEQVCLILCDLLETITCPLDVQEGCVQITVSIPVEVAEDAFPLTPTKKKAFQKAFPTLISICCGKILEIFDTAEDTDNSMSLDGQEKGLDEGFNEGEKFADGSESDVEEVEETYKKTCKSGTSCFKTQVITAFVSLSLVLAVLSAGLMWFYTTVQWNTYSLDSLDPPKALGRAAIGSILLTLIGVLMYFLWKRRQKASKNILLNTVLQLFPVYKCSFTGGHLRKPRGIAVSKKGEIFVTASGQENEYQFANSTKMSTETKHFIQVFSEDGKWLREIAVDLKAPCGIDINDSHLYVADCVDQRIVKAPLNISSLSLNTSQSSELDLKCPYGLTIVREIETMYICDEEKGRVVATDLQFNLKYVLGDHGVLSGPVDVAYNSSTSLLYVADHKRKKQIVVFQVGKELREGGGTPVDEFNSTLNGEKTFNRIHGICIADGHIYIADIAEHIVIVMDLARNLVATIGNEELYYPTSVTVHNQNVYITSDGKDERRAAVHKYQLLR